MRRGQRKGGRIRKECIERGNISYRMEGSEDRRGKKGTRRVNVKGAGGEKIKKGREKIKEKR
jgi:hypothetical protein